MARLTRRQRPGSWDDTTVSPGAKDPGTGERRTTRAWQSATVVAGVNTVALILALTLTATVWLSPGEVYREIAEVGAWLNLIAGPTFPLLGALMLRTRGRDPSRPVHQDRLAWLFVGSGVLCTATIVLRAITRYALPQHAPLALAGAWVSSWLWIGVFPSFLLAILWFPTGQYAGRSGRWLARVMIANGSALWLATAFKPGPMDDFPGHANPLGWAAGRSLLSAIAAAAYPGQVVVILLVVGSLAWRYRRGDGIARAQLRWLLIAIAVHVLTAWLPHPAALDGVAFALNLTSTLLLPVTLAVALARRDGLVLPRLLVFGFLSTLLLTCYIAVVGTAEAAFGARADRSATLAAAALVTILVAPLRARLQRSVDHLIYGDRGDPYAALSELGRRLASSPDDLLHEVVAAVADALRSPYVAVVLAGDPQPTALVGHPMGGEVTVLLSLRGHDIGSLVVAQRTPSEHFGGRDLALLHELARHIAVAAHAAALTRDLQRSRESLVIAREEERRRIRRDLHDGLGPALAGVAFGLDAARNTLTANPDGTAQALASLKQEVQGSLAEVRRLVYDLRPPALDQLGLVPALSQYAARLGEGSTMDVSVSAPALPPLPAAVEVAAYRIATEALTNVARHARARQSEVLFRIEETALWLEVVDDGIGVPARRAPGVGLAAMAERAAELGGSCSVSARTGGGTAVVAKLPLGAIP
jgi:two-component system, NarL family, sensor kinase